MQKMRVMTMETARAEQGDAKRWTTDRDRNKGFGMGLERRRRHGAGLGHPRWSCRVAAPGGLASLRAKWTPLRVKKTRHNKNLPGLARWQADMRSFRLDLAGAAVEGDKVSRANDNRKSS